VNQPTVSIVIPLLNEEESLRELAQWIRRSCSGAGLSYEVIFVDDGSRDLSWEVICSLTKEDSQIRGIRFARNYGKSAALHVGFEATLGEYVITMDADLQDSPDEIPALVAMLRDEHYDLVSGWKKKRPLSTAPANTESPNSDLSVSSTDFSTCLPSPSFPVLVKNRCTSSARWA